MSSVIPDLWPENFGATTELTPSAILKVQASKLGEKTGGVVVGEVKTRAGDGDGKVYSSFNLVAPALNNYRYKLFDISHQFDPYPITILLSSSRPVIQVKDQQQFLEKLREILCSDTTARIINSLIQHSQE